jgi:hypothetical protein
VTALYLQSNRRSPLNASMKWVCYDAAVTFKSTAPCTGRVPS